MSKVALITGASKGIGRAIAGRLAQEGMRVVVCSRTQLDLDEVVREIGPNAAALAVDLREEDAGERVVTFALETFGGLDVVVNNAGATKRGNFLELTEADFQDGFALKYFGAVRVARAAWPHLKAAGGSLVFIAGSGGRTPGAQFTIGGSVNAAVLSLTKALAELGIEDGVQVNCVNPGTIRTARYMTRLTALAKSKGIRVEEAEGAYVKEARVTRVGEPEEIAAMVAFITGPEGRFLQGSLIDMDGGVTKTV